MSQLIPTERIPGAHGKAEIKGTTVEVRADGLKPATLFGGDFNTYVVWLLPEKGDAQNAGEIVLDGDDGRLQISTTLSTFGVLITAEPHFGVAAPSRFVVLQTRDSSSMQYRTSETPYNYERDTLAGTMRSKSEAHTDVHQALTAYRLAQRIHADVQFVREALDDTLRLARENAKKEDIRTSARRTVRLASEAERLISAN